jgi:E3 ubiquitin-protein ligase BRE1
MVQTKFSLLLNDNSKLKSALEETRNVLEMSRNTFQQRLEHMESEELAQQKRLGNEMMQLEEQLTQVRKENELLRIEYEQNVAANEQTGPINKEMRSLITTLQTKNKLLQSDNSRTKKRVEEMQQDLDKAKKQNSQLQAQLQQQQQIKKESSAGSDVKAEPMQVDSGSQKQACSSSESSNDVKQSNSGSETETTDEKIKKIESKDSIIKDLKEQNKKLQENQKDMKNIIEIYSKSNKQQSPPSNSSNNNNNNNNSSSSSGKHKSELDEARVEIKRLKECIDKMKSATSSSSKVIIPTQQIPANSSSPSTHHAHHDEHASTPTSNSTPTSSSSSSNPSVNEHIKKIKTLEENVRELHKSLNNKKQEEVALLNDMEITGQAFEDMQVN